jgi:CheY-like chemotaxis protein
MQKLKILVVDDEPGVHELIPALMGNEGFVFAFAYQAQDALEKFDRFHPDLILLDVHMPGASGFVALRRLKALAASHDSRCKIIMMTSRISREDVQTALAYGADDYIAKPVNLSTLGKKIERHFPRILNDVQPPAASRLRRQAINHILIVDDEEDMRALLQTQLKASGKRLSFARNSTRAFEILMLEDQIDLILLDLNMDGMDGIEFLESLREKKFRDYSADFAHQTHKLDAIQSIPVLVLTGSRNPEKVKRLRTLGIAGYIAKPFQKDQLLEKIDSIASDT